MKARTLALVLLIVTVASVSAQEEPGPVRLGLSAQVTASVFAVQPTLNTYGAYRFGAFGLGAGLKTWFPGTYTGLFLAPHARVELGWFYLGGGPLILLEQADSPEWTTLDTNTTYFATLGLEIPVIRFGSAQIGVDTGFDFSVTPSPVIVTDTGNFFADFIATIVTTVVGAAANTIKGNLGISYSARL